METPSPPARHYKQGRSVAAIHEFYRGTYFIIPKSFKIFP